jgi:hypothetical protein
MTTNMQITTEDPGDVSNGQGYEDAVTGQPNRASEAPDPDAYRAGWVNGIRDTRAGADLT